MSELEKYDNIEDVSSLMFDGEDIYLCSDVDPKIAALKGLMLEAAGLLNESICSLDPSTNVSLIADCKALAKKLREAAK